MKAYHFVGKKLRDGSAVPKDGVKLVMNGTPVLCARGYHASAHPFDALKHAPGDTLCLVRLGGTILDGGDKLCATERTILQRIDATALLRYFARMQALSVVDLWLEEPPQVVLDWLMTGDKKLRAAAESAAWLTESAAESAVRSAAWSAGSAAQSAWLAESAAWSAAWSAARSVWSAWSAESAAQSAARDAFAALVTESLG